MSAAARQVTLPPGPNAIHLEQGYADVLAPHERPLPAEHPPLPVWLQKWERIRPHWLMELIAEATGTFTYVYVGVGAQTAFTLTSAAGLEGYGSILQIGFAYGLAISLAVMLAAPTSGGHLSPGYTIAFAIFKGFPLRKVPQYIVSQILGAFIACLLVYAQYRNQYVEVVEAIREKAGGPGPAADAIIFSPQGPGGILAMFPTEGQGLGHVFLNEFVVTVFLAVVIFTVLDSSNFFVGFKSAPFIIGIGYMLAIWGFAVGTAVLNTARDLGGRFACGVIYGSGAFPVHYSALAALTNIAGTVVGALFQILFLADSTRPIVTPPPQGSAEMMAKKRKESKLSDLEDGTSMRRRGTNATTDVMVNPEDEKAST